MRVWMLSLIVSAILFAGCANHEFRRGDGQHLPAAVEALLPYRVSEIILPGSVTPDHVFVAFLDDPATSWSPDAKLIYSTKSYFLERAVCVEPARCESLQAALMPYRLESIKINVLLSEDMSVSYAIISLEDTTTVFSPDVMLFYYQMSGRLAAVTYYYKDKVFYIYNPITHKISRRELPPKN